MSFGLLRIGLYYLLIVNLFMFLIIGWDKWQAKRGKPRVRETSLLGIAFVGGTPAAYVARAVFRHKIHKRSFGRLLFGVFVLQSVLVCLYLGYRIWGGL